MSGQEVQTGSKELLTGIIKKPWGHERIIENNGLYIVKELYVRSGCKLSLQYHKRKIETLFLVAGDGFMQLEERGRLVFFTPMKFVPKFIGRRQVHRLGAGGHDALFIEVSTPELSDIVRLEDDYGRA